MPDEFKKILNREIDELKQNKIRAGLLGACLIVLIIFWITEDNSSGEEILIEDTTPITKDLPVKVFTAEDNSDGIKIVLGATADEIFISDPFDFENDEKPKPITVKPPEIPKIAPVPPVVVQTPPLPIIPESHEEEFILVGTAISGENKMAMFLLDEKTLFLTIGEKISGQIISDITPDSVVFESGERVYLQKELN